MKTFRYIMWGLVAIVAGMSGYLALNQTAPKIDGTQVAAIGGPFELTNHKNEPISQNDILGRPHAIFFGFTHCPDICPMTLLETANWMKTLGSDADSMDFYFFTVDPERDTPEILTDYVNAFDPRITAVTGEADEMTATIKKYRAYAKKVDLGEGDYTMDHSASMMLFRPDGSFQGTIAYGENDETAVAKLQRLIDNS